MLQTCESAPPGDEIKTPDLKYQSRSSLALFLSAIQGRIYDGFRGPACEQPHKMFMRAVESWIPLLYGGEGFCIIRG